MTSSLFLMPLRNGSTKRVVGDDRVRLTKEGVHRLSRPAAHEGGELIDIFGLGGVKLRRQAEWKDPLNDHLLDVAESLGDGLPVADDNLEKRIAPPSDRPLTCAFSTPIACMKPATSSASNSVE